MAVKRTFTINKNAGGEMTNVHAKGMINLVSEAVTLTKAKAPVAKRSHHPKRKESPGAHKNTIYGFVEKAKTLLVDTLFALPNLLGIWRSKMGYGGFLEEGHKKVSKRGGSSSGMVKPIKHFRPAFDNIRSNFSRIVRR